MTKEKLLARKEQLLADRERLVQLIQAHDGAIQDVEYWLTELEKEKTNAQSTGTKTEV